MMNFLKEYWLWILVPMLLILAALAVLLLMAGGDDSASPFQYNVF